MGPLPILTQDFNMQRAEPDRRLPMVSAELLEGICRLAKNEL